MTRSLTFALVLGLISSAAMALTAPSFNRLDDDDSGKLSKDEVMAAPREIGQAIMKGDQDGDSMITKSEYRSVVDLTAVKTEGGGWVDKEV